MSYNNFQHNMWDDLRDKGKAVAFETLSLLGRHPGRTVEYGFAVDNMAVTTRNLLDVGSAGSSFPLQMAKRGFKVTAVDVRPHRQTHENLNFIQADITKLPFPAEFFDTITCISTIEHLGLSAYGDPRHDNADESAIIEFKRVLVSQGRLILTTPYSSKYHLLKWKDTYERIYDQDKIESLFASWKMVKEHYYVCRRWQDWVCSTKAEAKKLHPAYPRANLSCFVLEKP
jgi:ubiquinone/menaquinone biosynthesis C-methylase UbiE